MNTVAEDLTRIVGLKSRGSCDQLDALQEYKELQYALQNGTQTTGDRIRDYVLYHTPLADFDKTDERVRAYRDLERLLSEHKEEPVLVVRKEEGCHRDLSFSLGIIDQLAPFEVSSDLCGIKIGKHPNIYTPCRCCKGWQKYDEDMSVHGLDGTSEEPRFIVGKAAVEEFFLSDKTHELTFYAHGLQMLGAKVPEVFQKSVDDAYAYRRKLIVDNLGQMITMGDEHEWIPGQPEKVRPRIIKWLGSAIEAGLHNDTELIDGPRKGVKIVVGSYVRGLCEAHKVRIPKKG